MVPTVTHFHVTNDACEFGSAFQVPHFCSAFHSSAFSLDPLCTFYGSVTESGVGFPDQASVKILITKSAGAITTYIDYPHEPHEALRR
jgi:hypothetical protein